MLLAEASVDLARLVVRCCIEDAALSVKKKIAAPVLFV